MSAPTDVFHAESSVVSIGSAWIERLIQAAAEAPRRRARLCLHRDLRDRVQEMVIALRRESLVRPHRHEGSESVHVLEGSAELVLFDEVGGVSRRIRLGEGGERLCRISEPVWHTLLSVSPCVVLHETVCGPFDPAHQSFAPFAPADEGPALADWLERLRADGTLHPDTPLAGGSSQPRQLTELLPGTKAAN